MAIYNKRIEFTTNQLINHFEERNSILSLIYGIIRFIIIIIQNLYCVSSYLILSWIVLLPLSWLKSDLYSAAENYLYNSLLYIVSSWSLAAGATIVEAGDEYKHLIEEPTNDFITDCKLKQNNRNDTSIKHQMYKRNGFIRKSRTANENRTEDRISPKQANGTHTTRNLSSEMSTIGDEVINYESRTKSLHNGMIHKQPNSNDPEKLTDKVTRMNGVDNNNFIDILYKNNEHSASEPNSIICNNYKEKSSDEVKKSIQHNGRIEVCKQLARGTSINCNNSFSLKVTVNKPRVLLLCNHISTADVLLMMQSFSTLTNHSLLWVLDAQFKFTQFGLVCSSHGDFFVSKNTFSSGSLRDQVLKHPDRNLLVLFPEGGFLKKRIAGSNRYANRNNLPVTKYVTHPRFGAFKDLIDPSVGVTHIVDATLLYSDINNPLSILDIALGNKKEPALIYYKLYERSEINPTEEWLRDIWLRKDKLLEKYYNDRPRVLKMFGNRMRSAELDWFKVFSVHLFYLLVCYLTIYRLFIATSVTMLKARELYYSTI